MVVNSVRVQEKKTGENKSQQKYARNRGTVNFPPRTMLNFLFQAKP